MDNITQFLEDWFHDDIDFDDIVHGKQYFTEMIYLKVYGELKDNFNVELSDLSEHQLSIIRKYIKEEWDIAIKSLENG